METCEAMNTMLVKVLFLYMGKARTPGKQTRNLGILDLVMGRSEKERSMNM